MSVEALSRLLKHPAIWRGSNAADVETISTGFAALDECLPGGGWPRAGLVEILIPRLGVGELYLLMPALAALTRSVAARWCTWVAPPFEPFAPALIAQGFTIERVLVVRAEASLWALEQALSSRACDSVLAWVRRVTPRDVRRLQLAAEQGRTLGVLFRGQGAARVASPAMLRMQVEPAPAGVRITMLKSRGGQRGSIHLEIFS